MIKRPILYLLLSVTIFISTLAPLAGCHRITAADALPATDRAIEARAWADSVMARLTTEQRVAQLFVPRLDYVASRDGIAAIRRIVANTGIGGFLLGKGSLTDYATLINEAQSVAHVPLLVTLDGEWGLAMRINDAPRYPYNMSLGAIRDTRLLYSYGSEVGRQCRAVGINVDFAPVLDVNSNPSNPVIGYRSFGDDPERVASLGVAFAHGLESAGVMSVAKHFPGHGDTSTDSHKTLPTVAHGRSTLDRVDLMPFNAYINAGLSGIMAGHLRVPALDSSGAPASLSTKISTKLLRDNMHFSGLLFTDALAMKGAVHRNENNCIAALRAGADVLLSPASLESDIRAVVEAVRKGRLSKKIIDDRCHRLLVYKYLLGIHRFRPADVASIKKVVNAPQSRMVLDSLADAMITAVSNADNLLPLRALGSSRIAVVTIGAPASSPFARYCAKYAPVDIYSIEGGTPSQSLLQKLRKADVVVAAVFSHDTSARTVFSKLTDISRLVPVFFINPYKMAPFASALSDVATLVAAYESLPSIQRAAAEAVFGGIDVDGRFPVDVSGIARSGEGVSIPKVRLGYATPLSVGLNPSISSTVDSIAEAAVEAQAVSGCQVLVAKDGQIVLEKAFGKIDFGNAPEVTTETLFDLASVSKTNATLVGLMKAIDEEVIKLSDRIGDHIAELDSTDKGDITIRQLLFHESGMPAVINIYRLALDRSTYNGAIFSSTPSDDYSIKMGRDEYGNNSARLRSDIYSSEESDEFPYPVADGIFVSDQGIDAVIDAVHSAPLHSKRYDYSCLNFMLLKEIQERATGVDLDQWIDTEIYGPLGAWHTAFLPLQRFPKSQIAATENDRFLRRRHIHGYVHDEMAAFSGGISGNAGLFSTAADVAKLCQMWLCDGAYGGEQIIAKSTARTFTTLKSPSGRRGLGFDLLAFNRSLGSPKASSNTFGHTGFTGTCFWIDPERNLIFVFLGNRVNPSRDNAAWLATNPRGAILRAVYDAI